MESLDCLRQKKDIEVQLASYERESSALAREALCPTTSESRRVEALISRAEIQARIAALVKGMQSNPWPRVGQNEGSKPFIGLREGSTLAREL